MVRIEGEAGGVLGRVRVRCGRASVRAGVKGRRVGIEPE